MLHNHFFYKLGWLVLQNHCDTGTSDSKLLALVVMSFSNSVPFRCGSLPRPTPLSLPIIWTLQDGNCDNCVWIPIPKRPGHHFLGCFC